MSNAVVRQSNGLIKIDKDATTKRIDPVDATLCAYKLAMFHQFGDDYGDYIDSLSRTFYMKITQIIKKAWNNLIGSSDDLSDEELLEWIGIDTSLKNRK